MSKNIFIIEDNFNFSSKNREASIRKKTEGKNPDQLLEDRFWLLLKKLGFEGMNHGRECKVTSGKEDNPVVKKIDVVAECSYSRLYVECTTEKKADSKIAKFSGDWESIRKFDTKKTYKPDEHYKVNCGGVFVYDKELSDTNKNKLKAKGIAYFDSDMIDYFYYLESTYTHLAYIQFLSYIFQKHTIRKLDVKDYEIPAIRTKYDNKNYCYLFAIQPSILLPMSGVFHRMMIDGKKDKLEAYQRIIKKKKVNDIAKFLVSADTSSHFPTNIVVNADSLNWSTGKKISESISVGVVKLPNKFRSISIIDGQHRLYAYAHDLAKGIKSKRLLFVSAYENMSMENQVETFIDINDNQTKLDPSLKWDLYPLTLSDSTRRYKISLLIKKLNTQKETHNALYRTMSYDSAPKLGNTKQLTLVALCRPLYENNSKRSKDIETIFHRLLINENDYYNYHYINILSFANAIKSLGENEWKRKVKSENILCHNQTFGIYFDVLFELMNYLYHSGDCDKNDKEIFKDSFKNKDSAALASIYRKYLKPFVDDVKDLKFDKKKITEYKGGSGGGYGAQNQILKKVLICIRRKYPSFAKDRLSNMEDERIKSIINSFENKGGEQDTLELKATFIADYNKYIFNGELVKNKEYEKGVMEGIAKSITAMYNTKGGQILIGADDNGKLIGLDNTDFKIRSEKEYKNFFNDKVSNWINPKIPKTLDIVKSSGLTFVIITVQQLPENSLHQANPFECFTYEGKERIYVRNDDKTEELFPSQFEKHKESISP